MADMDYFSKSEVLAFWRLLNRVYGMSHVSIVDEGKDGYTIRVNVDGKPNTVSTYQSVIDMIQQAETQLA